MEVITISLIIMFVASCAVFILNILFMFIKTATNPGNSNF